MRGLRARGAPVLPLRAAACCRGSSRRRAASRRALAAMLAACAASRSGGVSSWRSRSRRMALASKMSASSVRRSWRWRWSPRRSRPHRCAARSTAADSLGTDALIRPCCVVVEGDGDRLCVAGAVGLDMAHGIGSGVPEQNHTAYRMITSSLSHVLATAQCSMRSFRRKGGVFQRRASVVRNESGSAVAVRYSGGGWR